MARFRAGAALLTLAILLLPSLCNGHAPALAPVSGVQPVDLPCHEPAPANPELPGSQQKCCGAAHQSEALLSSISPAPTLTAAGSWLDPLFYSSHPLNHPNRSFTVFSGPPGPFLLRI